MSPATEKKPFIEIAEARIRHALSRLPFDTVTDKIMETQIFIMVKALIADMCDERVHADHPFAGGVRSGWEGTEIRLQTWVADGPVTKVTIDVELALRVPPSEADERWAAYATPIMEDLPVPRTSYATMLVKYGLHNDSHEMSVSWCCVFGHPSMCGKCFDYCEMCSGLLHE